MSTIKINEDKIKPAVVESIEEGSIIRTQEDALEYILKYSTSLYAYNVTRRQHRCPCCQHEPNRHSDDHNKQYNSFQRQH